MTPQQPFPKPSLALAIAAALSGPTSALAAPGDPLGTEFQVNTFTTDNQSVPAVAMDADGDFVVTWQSYSQDGSYYAIFAQRYDSAGAPQGGEFQVNTFTTGDQVRSAVAMDADGDFVAAWMSLGQDGSSWGIFAQRYDSAGVPQGGEFQVNTFTTNSQTSPAVAMDADGNFVVVWESEGQDGSRSGIFAQRYNSAGVPRGGEFQVNTFTTDSQWNPAVAMDAHGDFVVAWQGEGQDGSRSGIFAQRYNSAGAPQGSEFQVNTYTTSLQVSPTVAMDVGGNFVVAWMSDGQDGFGWGIFAQRYNSAGVPQGGEFQVNTFIMGHQGGPAVTMDAGGNFVVAWGSDDQDGDGYGVFAQRYDSAGVPQGGEFQVNTFTTGFQGIPAVAMDADGDFVVAWESYGQDGSRFGSGIFAQRFVGPEPVDLALAKGAFPETVTSGNPLSYSLMVTNEHANLAPTGIAAIDSAIGAASGVVLTDTLPAGMRLTSASNGDWDCTQDNGTVTCRLDGVLRAMVTSTVILEVIAPTTDGIITNTASVIANQFDPDTGNNTATEDTAVQVDVDALDVEPTTRTTRGRGLHGGD